METVSKNKRGRPTVKSRLYCDDSKVYDMIKSDSSNESERSHTNAMYWFEGMRIIELQYPDEGGTYNSFIRGFFFTGGGKKRRSTIVEQIGRMSAQNGFDDAVCLGVAVKAIQYIKDGYTVREVERWIRELRNNN